MSYILNHLNHFSHIYRWTTEPDLSSIEVSDITPGNLEKLWNSVAPSLQTLIFNVIVSIIIYLVGKKLISVLLKILEKFLAHTDIDIGVSRFLMSAARVVLYALMIFMIVGQLGINTASIVTVLGTAGIAIGMSLQGSLANVAGGILILLMKPFRVGDYVLTSYGDGTVQNIGLVYTALATVDNRVLTIPNGVLSNSAVFDASMMPERRLDVSVGISYDSDIRKAKQIFEEVYRSCPSIVPDREINVHVSSLSDSSVVLETFGWVKGSEYLKAKWYVNEEVKLRFDEAGIKIPFPQVDVHLETAKD